MGTGGGCWSFDLARQEDRHRRLVSAGHQQLPHGEAEGSRDEVQEEGGKVHSLEGVPYRRVLRREGLRRRRSDVREQTASTREFQMSRLAGILCSCSKPFSWIFSCNTRHKGVCSLQPTVLRWLEAKRSRYKGGLTCSDGGKAMRKCPIFLTAGPLPSWK